MRKVIIISLLLLVTTCLSAAEKSGRRLALLVGVGEYQSENIASLMGPPRDVAGLKELLVSVYDFDEENVVTLVNDTATRRAFNKRLARYADDGSKPEDLVLIYFSGHGARREDQESGDETDGFDEALAFHDARSDGRGFLVDDELFLMLQRITAGEVVLILDACFAAGAMRGVKSLPKIPYTWSALDDMVIKEKPRPGQTLVFLSATAEEDEPALDGDYNSMYTEALLGALSAERGNRITYQTLTDRINEIKSPTAPEGAVLLGGHKIVFQSTAQRNNTAWRVTEATRKYVISEGAPWPGWSQDAVVYIYSAGASKSQMEDPDNAIARMSVKEMQSNRQCRLTLVTGDWRHIEPGDQAVLAVPGRNTRPLQVSLRSSQTIGGYLSPKDIKSFQKLISENVQYAKFVTMVDSPPSDFEVIRHGEHDLSLLDNNRNIRITLPAEMMPHALYLYALQKNLLGMADDMMKGKHKPLSIQIVGEKKGVVHSPTSGHFTIEHCNPFKIKVTHRETATQPLRISGLYLSGDGSILGFPNTNEPLPLLNPGDSWTLDKKLCALPPHNVTDFLLVLGTPASDGAGWRHAYFKADQSRTRANGNFDSLTALVPGIAGKVRTRLVINDYNSWVIARAELKVTGPEQTDPTHRCNCL
ncbi:MAG: caspase family protein [Acidobacteriota bacterium]|nr:caspase family protein [Acidobacteriota bacterium]